MKLFMQTYKQYRASASFVKARPKTPLPHPHPVRRTRLLLFLCAPPAPVRCYQWSARCELRAHSLKMPPRRRYSNQEYVEMVWCYRECNNITTHAANLCQQGFGVRISPHTILDAVYTAPLTRLRLTQRRGSVGLLPTSSSCEHQRRG